jgi:hypothetical protein
MAGDFTQDMLNRLEDRYLRSEYDEEGINTFGTKEESSSSDAESVKS